MVAASNPNAYLLFAVFLPQFIDVNNDGAGSQILLIGVVYIAVEFCCACGYAMVGGRLRIIGMTARVKRLLDRITGTAMIGLAAWVALEKG